MKVEALKQRLDHNRPRVVICGNLSLVQELNRSRCITTSYPKAAGIKASLFLLHPLHIYYD